MTSTDEFASRQQNAQTVPPFNSKPVRTAMHLTSTNLDSQAIQSEAEAQAGYGAEQEPLSARLTMPKEKVGAAAHRGARSPAGSNDGGKNAAHVGDSTRSEANDGLRRIMGPRLVWAREQAGLHQGEAARLLGQANPTQIALWETCRRLVPLSELLRVADLYGVSETFLLGKTLEPERDPSRALRAATVRGLRGMLDGVAERMTDEIGRFATLCGPDATNARAVLGAGMELLDALGVMQRQPEFDDVHGGAKVTRVAREFEERLSAVREAIARFDALDLALRERLRTAVAANDEELGM